MKFCSYFWYNIGGQYTQRMPLVSLGPFFGIFWAYFGILRQLFENRPRFYHEILYRHFWRSFLGSLLYFFLHIMTLLGSLRGVWPHFWECSSNTLELFSIFSWNFLQVFLA